MQIIINYRNPMLPAPPPHATLPVVLMSVSQYYNAADCNTGNETLGYMQVGYYAESTLRSTRYSFVQRISFLGHYLWHISFTTLHFRASAFFGHYLKHRCIHHGVLAIA